tara:strand:+ start:201 stop:512 length:312 start_codon:yes stop_codon:yes gene_type:complete
MIFNEMKTIKAKVVFLLQKHPELRDDDYKLISSYFYYTIGKNNIESMTGYEFLKRFSTGLLGHTESIRRTRAKIQEQDVSLRGICYGARREQGKITAELIHFL